MPDRTKLNRGKFPKKNVVIVTGICANKKSGFGIRFEEHDKGNWIADWSFPLRADTAKREGYDNSTITGSFQFSECFPGCPNCDVNMFVMCGCGAAVCYDGESSTLHCPACGSTGPIGGTVEQIAVKSDR